MDPIFINPENCKTSIPHVLMLNLTDNIDLRRDEKSFIKSQFISYMEKQKNQTTAIN